MFTTTVLGNETNKQVHIPDTARQPKLVMCNCLATVLKKDYDSPAKGVCLIPLVCDSPP